MVRPGFVAVLCLAAIALAETSTGDSTVDRHQLRSSSSLEIDGVSQHDLHGTNDCKKHSQIGTFLIVIFLLLALVFICIDNSKANTAMEDVEKYLEDHSDEYTKAEIVELNLRKTTVAMSSNIMTFCVLVNIVAMLGFATRQGVSERSDCSEIFYARYVAWLITTPLMLWVMGTMVAMDAGTKIFIVVCDIGMIWTGWLADTITGVNYPLYQSWCFFGVALVCYLPVLYFLLVLLPRQARSVDPTLIDEWSEGADKGTYSTSIVYKTGKFMGSTMAIWWSAYPLFWILGATHTITRYNQNMAYNLLDTFTKLFLTLSLNALWPVYAIRVSPSPLLARTVQQEMAENVAKKSGGNVKATLEQMLNQGEMKGLTGKKFLRALDLESMNDNYTAVTLAHPMAQIVLGKDIADAMHHLASHPTVAATVLPGLWTGVRNADEDLLLLSDFHDPCEMTSIAGFAGSFASRITGRMM